MKLPVQQDAYFVGVSGRNFCMAATLVFGRQISPVTNTLNALHFLSARKPLDGSVPSD
jgi:hypothetical protein